MKITVNYDLIHKINESKTGMKLQQNLFDEIRFCTIAYLTVSTFECLFNNSNLSENLLNDLKVCLGLFIVRYGIDTICDKFFVNKAIISDSNIELIRLSALLNQYFELDTNYELLKESTLTKTGYKITINKNNIPIITQNKYILVPTYDSLGNVNETSLLQEHNIGSRNYVLSIGSPNKVLKRRYACSM